MDGLKCDVCEFVNPSDHSYCGACGTKLNGVDRSTSIINAPLQGDRRQVTIIFADISGFTALNDAATTPAEVEQVVRLINELLSELSEAIYEYDGYIDKYVGDEIMALFGAPTAHENDPELALRAALSMMERLKKFNDNPPVPLPRPLGIHMGVNTGMVIAGMVGTSRKSSYTVMGDAVNVAARLESVSVRGEILVNENTYNLTNRLFHFEERDPIQVKGKAKPLKIYLLKEARDLSQTQRGLSGMEAPLIGREHEVSAMTTAYRNLRQGEGSIVTVTGDAGLGKSRLISEVMKSVRQEEQPDPDKESLWLFGRGLAYRQSFANRLFVDILYSYLELPENADDTQVKLKLSAMGDDLFGSRKDEVVPYLAAMLGVKLESDADPDLPLNEPQVLQRRVFVAMGEWIEALIARRPVVLVFEDLHWADPSSVQLIEFLFTLTVYNPILIVCVTRLERGTHFWKVKSASAEDLSDRFQELTLWPLTNEESRHVIRHLLKIDPLPGELETLLLSRAEGNPLFLEEVIRSLIEEGVIERVDEQWKITSPVTEIDIPNTLQGVLTARIDRLDDAVRRVLQVAAVIGRAFPHFILSPIVNEPEVLEKALDQLEVADLIEVKTREPEPEYIFKHVLTYETAYNSLLHQQRQMIHKQIGDYLSRQYWLLGEEYAPNVADHYEKSGTWDRALRYLQRAAVAAIQSFANQEAISFYSRALEVADIIGSRVDQKTLLEIYEGRAKIYTRLGEIQEAMADYEALLVKAEELNDVSAQMRALAGNGALQASHQNFALAAEYLQKALGVARQVGDENGIADTLNQLGNYHYQMGELETATACFREASDLSTKGENDLARLTSEDGLAKVMLEQGEIKASLERYQSDIIPLNRRLGYRSGLMNSLYSVLMGQVFTADYRAAETTAQELLELHKKSGDFYRVPLIKYYQGLAHLYQGYIDAARSTLQEGLDLAEEQEQKSSIALGLAWMGYSNLTVGLAELGLQQAERSLKMAHELGSPLYIMKTQSILGTAYRHLDRLNESVIELENVQINAHNMGFTSDEVMILYQLVRAYIDTQAWDEAQSRLNDLLNLATVSEMKEFVARGLWLQGMIETHHQQFDTAIETLSQAAATAQETASRITHYSIQIQQAVVHRCAGNVDAAKTAVAEARNTENKIIQHIASEEIRQTFLAGSHANKLRDTAEALPTTPAS